MNAQTIWQLVMWFAGWLASTGIAIYVVKQMLKGIGNRITVAVDAYAGERAKLTAQFHNLDKLVEQTKALTATTETIKARVSSKAWDRQMRWTFKKDVYVRLMEVLGQHHNTFDRNMHLELVRRRDPKDPRYIPARDEAIRRSNEVQQDLVRISCSAPLVINSEAHDLLIACLKSLRHVNYDSPDFADNCNHNLVVIQSAMDQLILAARKDLGLATSELTEPLQR